MSEAALLDTPQAQEVVFDVINHVGIATLNRPKALNALSHTMILALGEQLTAWRTDARIRAVLLRGAGGKAFCAGGDIRALYQAHHAGNALRERFFVDEYALDYLIHRYPKPVVALMDGITMGGGMGLAQGAALRIVSERSRVAMPETGIGLVPDVGASHFLSKMQVELALYLGLTGVTLQAEDAVCSGLADLVWSSERMAGIESWLADLAWGEDPLTTLTAALATAGAARPYEAPLLAHLSAIHRHFSPARDVADLMASLAQAGAPDAAWREATLRLLQTRSPLMMCVTRALLLRGRRCDLADSFRMELNVVQHAFDIGDFIEGTRALIVDKDNRPQWRVGDAASCGAAQVDAFFAPRWLASAHPLRRLGAAGG